MSRTIPSRTFAQETIYNSGTSEGWSFPLHANGTGGSLVIPQDVETFVYEGKNSTRKARSPNEHSIRRCDSTAV